MVKSPFTTDLLFNVIAIFGAGLAIIGVLSLFCCVYYFINMNRDIKLLREEFDEQERKKARDAQ